LTRGPDGSVDASAIKVTVVVPAFNESATIGGVIADLCRRVDEIIVVNDASTDDTARVAEAAGAIVVTHPVNRGYDASLNDGFAAAIERGAAVIATFDADGEHRPEDIPAVIGPIVDDQADVVITERPYLVHFSEKIFAAYTRLRFGIDDPLCGFKAYHRRVYERFGRFDTLNSIGTELTLRAVKAGFRLKIVPIPRRTRLDTSRFYARLLRANARIFGAMLRVVAMVR
jgi:glycosyltransferase involved in cell wall biosynthesis